MKAILRFTLGKLVATFKFLLKTVLTATVPAVFGVLFSSLVLINSTLFGFANDALQRLGLDTANSAAQKSVQEDRLAKRKAAKEIRGKAIGKAKTSAKRNIAAMPLEAVPVLGVATVLAVTVWEINDLCEIMIYVDELSTLYDPEAASDETTELCKSWREEVNDMTSVIKKSE